MEGNGVLAQELPRVGNAPIGKGPEHKFRAGGVSATIWRNESEKGSFSSVKLEKSYKDSQDNWKTTSSFGVNDLPKAILVLSKAYEYTSMKDAGQGGG